MKNFEKNELVKLKVEDLIRAVDEEGNRVYSRELLQEIYNHNYENVNKMLEDYQRKDRDYMEPLLYAVKNTMGTYIIYNYYSEGLQNDEILAMEIIKDEPELIKGTPISRNSEFILKAAQTNPKVMLYMDEDLSKDIRFNEQRKEIVKDITNVVIIHDMIKQDSKLIEYIPSELKNNYEFMQTACKENKEVIDYVVEHTEDFGLEGINATKEVLADNTINMAVSDIEEQFVKIQNKEEVDEKSTEEGALSERTLRCAMRIVERIKDGKVSPERAARRINVLCQNLDEKYKKEIEKYIKLDDVIIERQKEEEEHFKVEPSEIEDVTMEECTVSSINGPTEDIRQGYKEIPMLTNDEKGMDYNESEETR